MLLDDDGHVISKKISSSVENYALAIVEGLESVFATHGAAPDEVAEIMHGTTVASNAIIELAGARVGLVTSKGFRDVLELRNLRMPRLYDLTWEKPPPLVERYLRMVVDERVNAAGEVVRPLPRDDARRAVRRLLDEGAEAIAICLINSYANPVHERIVAEVVEELSPGLSCCTSFDVLPEIKEYERTSTHGGQHLRAADRPALSEDLARRELDTRAISAPLLIMQSNGGLTPAAEAAVKPVNIVESGPAAGVVGARAIARQSDVENVISFDMGGDHRQGVSHRARRIHPHARILGGRRHHDRLAPAYRRRLSAERSGHRPRGGRRGRRLNHPNRHRRLDAGRSE